MTRTLVLEAPVRMADGAGGVVQDWQALGTLWADVQAGSPRQADGVVRVPLKIAVRAARVGAPSRPVAGQRLREGGRVFRILAVTESGRDLICHAEEAP